MSVKVVMVDNYDSFTYNLVQFLGECESDIQVVRNDAVEVSEIEELHPSHIIISPGPGRPEHAGISLDVVKQYQRTIPILGVCLGHQVIAQALHGKIVHAPELMHGKMSLIQHDGKTIFQGLQNPIQATRYHSLVVSSDAFPQELEVTARTADGTIMGLRHTAYPIEGVQFHPESFLTQSGKKLLGNFLRLKTVLES